MNHKETEISKRFRKISPNIFYDMHSAPAFIITLRLTKLQKQLELWNS